MNTMPQGGKRIGEEEEKWIPDEEGENLKSSKIVTICMFGLYPLFYPYSCSRLKSDQREHLMYHKWWGCCFVRLFGRIENFANLSSGIFCWNYTDDVLFLTFPRCVSLSTQKAHCQASVQDLRNILFNFSFEIMNKNGARLCVPICLRKHNVSIKLSSKLLHYHHLHHHHRHHHHVCLSLPKEAHCQSWIALLFPPGGASEYFSWDTILSSCNKIVSVSWHQT